MGFKKKISTFHSLKSVYTTWIILLEARRFLFLSVPWVCSFSFIFSFIFSSPSVLPWMNVALFLRRKLNLFSTFTPSDTLLSFALHASEFSTFEKWFSRTSSFRFALPFVCQHRDMRRNSTSSKLVTYGCIIE